MGGAKLGGGGWRTGKSKGLSPSLCVGGADEGEASADGRRFRGASVRGRMLGGASVGGMVRFIVGRGGRGAG